ncbi:MAG: DUF222 domain-containing protein [Candidatus Nanopelagicales bacterium]
MSVETLRDPGSVSRPGSVRARLAAVRGALDDALSVDLADLAEDELEWAVLALPGLLARVEALDARVLARYADSGAWGLDGHRTMRAWLRARTTAGEADISRRIGLGHLVDQHTVMAERLARGTVTADHLRVLASVWGKAPTTRPALEAAAEVIADYAEQAPPRELARFLTELTLRIDPDAADAADERALRDRAGLRLTVHDDGWVRVTAFLPPDLGIRLVAVLDAALAPPDEAATPEEAATPDAAGTSDATTPDPTAPDPTAPDPAPVPRAVRYLEALGRVLDAAETALTDDGRLLLPVGRGSRPVVHLTLDAPTLLGLATDNAAASGGGPGWPTGLGWSTGPGGDGMTRGRVPTSPESVRRLSCDAAVRRLVLDPAGIPIDVGRATRVIPTGTRIAVEHRDRHCRWPGCPSPIREVHHVVHWAGGGPTNTGNCVGLCWWHHRQVHEGGWVLRGDANDKLELRRQRDPLRPSLFSRPPREPREPGRSGDPVRSTGSRARLTTTPTGPP